MIPGTHEDLVERARHWLSKSHPIVITEMAAVGEEPDALGFKGGGWSTLVECKVSRADFLTDKKKFWRRYPDRGLGDYRYYCCPQGLIAVEELPAWWGLLETSGSGLQVRAKAVAVPQKKNHRSETCILMSTLRRIGRTRPSGVSIRCYAYESKNRATVSIETGGGCNCL